MDQFHQSIPSNSSQKEKAMAQKNSGESPDNSDDFEFINSDEIEFVKRGRKSNVDPKLVTMLSQLPKGKAVAISSLKVDPKADNFRTEKARISSQIRTACRQANLDQFRILWTPNGVPQVCNW